MPQIKGGADRVLKHFASMALLYGGGLRWRHTSESDGGEAKV